MAATKRGETVELVAVNHWPIAIATHLKNHPEVRHYCTPVEALDPREAVPSGKLDILIAAPECTHHSSARGGKPMNDQSRASAWHVLRWVELLRVETVLIENVQEFQTWGPLGLSGRPIKAKKGETFRAFIAALTSYGYRVEWKVLNAADYGAATTRRRLFIVATRTGRPIFPTATHSKTGSPTLFGGTKKWRAAREVIDWTLPSQSIFARKRPLKPATMRRILEGLRRFGGPSLEPFLVQLTHGIRTRDVDAPMPTIVAGHRGEIGVAEPVVVQFKGTHECALDSTGKPITDPLGTVTAGGGNFGLAEPFIVPYHAERDGQAPRTHGVGEPLPVVPTNPVFGLVEPFIVTPGGANLPGGRAVSDPLPTVMTSERFAVVEPFVLQQQSGGVARPVSKPAPTLAAKGAVSLVEPFIFANRTNNVPKSTDEPVPALCTAQHVGLVEPHLVEYYGNGQARSVDEPVPVVTTHDRFALVQPVVDGYTLDIKFRMLQPHELSAAMSFPKSYQFTGNKGEQIKQIGNAICCRMAEALCGAILDARTKPTRKKAAVA